MPQGSKAAYSGKQKRMARHIEDGYKKKGSSGQRAARIAWATVNKETGGAKGAKSKDRKNKSGGRKARSTGGSSSSTYAKSARSR